jgi:trans-2,3-dihydro-3-hydroxyanthranilate isomerase
LRRFAFDWVDAFTSTAFGGNGCMVVHDAAGLDDAACVALTRESRLTECTFVGPSATCDARVRFFLPTHEIPFAGHPTIATVVSLLDRALVKGPELTLETLNGALRISVRRGVNGQAVVEMLQVRPVFGAEVAVDDIVAITGMPRDGIVGVPQLVSTGLVYPVVQVAEAGLLAGLTLDIGEALHRLAAMSHPDGEVFEPFVIALEQTSAGPVVHARHLMVPPQPAEDAFTGSAMGPAMAYLWRSGALAVPTARVLQGAWMGRPGEGVAEVLGPRDAISGVRLAGQGHILMRGELRL